MSGGGAPSIYGPDALRTGVSAAPKLNWGTGLAAYRPVFLQRWD